MESKPLRRKVLAKSPKKQNKQKKHKKHANAVRRSLRILQQTDRSPFSNSTATCVVNRNQPHDWVVFDPDASTDTVTWCYKQLQLMTSRKRRTAMQRIDKDDDMFLGYLQHTLSTVNAVELARYSLLAVDRHNPERIVGMAIGHQLDAQNDNGQRILLSLLRVSKHWRKAKVGTGLMRAWLDKVTQSCCGGEQQETTTAQGPPVEILLECPLHLVPFYTSFGFEPCPYLGGQQCHPDAAVIEDKTTKSKTLEYHGMRLRKKGARWLTRQSSARSGVPAAMLNINDSPKTLCSITRTRLLV